MNNLWVKLGDGCVHSNVLAAKLNETYQGRDLIKKLYNVKITGRKLRFLWIDVYKADFEFFVRCIGNASLDQMIRLGNCLNETEESTFRNKEKALSDLNMLGMGLYKYFDETGIVSTRYLNGDENE